MVPRELSIAISLVALLLISSLGISSASAPNPAHNGLAAFSSHISHIIFLMQENHAFDNFYGVYCPTLTKYCSSTANGVPNGTCVPKNPTSPSAGCVVPYNLTAKQLIVPDMPHDWNSTHSSYNGGAMNGFYAAENAKDLPFGHYNGSTIPVYFDLAEQYALGDQFFSSSATYSLPNHWYMLSSSSPNISMKLAPQVENTSDKHLYLNQSNATPTLTDELVNSTVSWKFYDYPLPSYPNAIMATPVPGTAYDLWNPLAARHQSYLTGLNAHMVARSAFFSDAANGTLPAVSWVIPSPAYSDHPPMNVSLGQNWVASVVNALEGSPEWNSTVLFISWDEYGGYYDHVAPPVVSADGDGFRVPLLAVGPWVRQGFIDHQVLDFGSILHLMEKRFKLGCLGPRDCNAALPLSVFNFNRTARPPIRFPAWSNASYPMPLQSSGKLPKFSPFHGSAIIGLQELPSRIAPGYED
jgi:phospholipase C